jgi:hypothetical protein
LQSIEEGPLCKEITLVVLPLQTLPHFPLQHLEKKLFFVVVSRFRQKGGRFFVKLFAFVVNLPDSILGSILDLFGVIVKA